MSITLEDSYHILAVKRDATIEEIKKAYRELSKLYHPDLHQKRGSGVRDRAQEKMKELNEAYELLIAAHETGTTFESEPIEDEDIEREPEVNIQIVTCPICGRENRIREYELHMKPRCGKCGNPLLFSESGESWEGTPNDNTDYKSEEKGRAAHETGTTFESEPIEDEDIEREPEVNIHIMTCPICGTKNRIREYELQMKARCGKCGNPLFSESEQSCEGTRNDNADYKSEQKGRAQEIIAASCGLVLVFSIVVGGPVLLSIALFMGGESEAGLLTLPLAFPGCLIVAALGIRFYRSSRHKDEN